jgi:hypothetical protein
MATNLNVIVNKTANSNDYQTTPADFIVMDLVNDYLIWTAGSVAVADGADEPSEAELNEASTIIDPSNPVEVEKCLIYDDSEGAGTLRDIDNMGENERYVFGFSFDGDTASEPQLEAWDDTNHDSTDFHVLGAGTPANSMIKAVCTTVGLPGSAWSGSALAGASNVLLLNNGSGAVSVPSGQSTVETYCNLKIVIPAGYSTPGVEPFILTCRFTWN